MEGCEPPEVADVLDCSETEAEATEVFEHLVGVVTDPSLIGQVLRVDMASIEWMHADARQGAYQRDEFQDGAPVDDAKFVEVFGELEPQDIYCVFNPDDIHSTWDLGPTFIGLEENEEHGRVSLRVLRDIPTLITNGRYDLRFNARFIAPSLAAYTDVLTSAVWNETQPAGAERPGQIELEYLDGTTLVIPLPAYDAGHSVSHHAPAELHADVRAFIGG